MHLSADLLARFQKRYFDTFAEHISLETAEAELLGLAELIRITARVKQVNDDNLKEGEENGN